MLGGKMEDRSSASAKGERNDSFHRERVSPSVRILAIVVIIAIIVAGFLLDRAGVIDLSSIFSNNNGDGTLKMYAIDVGQGDSILMVSPTGKTMLVDAGDVDAFDAIDSLLTELNITSLDLVVATHPHSDHIGSMQKVLEKYGAKLFLMPDVEYSSKTYRKLIDTIDECHITSRYVFSGDIIEWDDSCHITVLGPVEGASYSEANMNEWSVILRVEYGHNAVILTGDAETVSEQISMFSNDESLYRADVLKVGHHGSSTSTSDAFLEAVAPTYALISLGNNNDYGHPHKEITQKLSAHGITVYRTDKVGTIIAVMDGTSVMVYPYSQYGG